MTPVTTICGNAYPLGRKNIDTDVIISSAWLKTISRTGLGKAAFEIIKSEPDNVFSNIKYANSPILIAGENFGCGSSREHAAWAMLDMGIHAVIANSFSDIFASNAFKNGILVIALPAPDIDRLMDVAEDFPIQINLEFQCITSTLGDHIRFEIDSYQKHCLLNGVDEISSTLSHNAEISTFEALLNKSNPWV